MANGAVARLQLISAPTTPPAVSAPAASSAIEREIGALVASAATAVCLAGSEMREGGLTAITRQEGARRVCRLAELRQAMPGIDFADIAYREGKKVLQGYLDADADYCRHHGPEDGHALLDHVLATLFEFVDRVSAFEADCRRTMVN